MSLGSKSQCIWCLVAAVLLCLSRGGVSSSALETQGGLRTLLTEVVSKALRAEAGGLCGSALLREVVSGALREHCPAAEQTPGWRCSCPSGFTPCGGRCYARLHRAVEYGQAEKECAAIGAHLAVPRSRDQNLCVAGLAGYEGVWLGVTDRGQEGVFQGADGRLVTANEGQAWAIRQPDNAGGREHCVEIRTVKPSNRFAEWNDWRCAGVKDFPMCQLPDV